MVILIIHYFFFYYIQTHIIEIKIINSPTAVIIYFYYFLGITYSADCYAYCVMTHLLWPTRSEQYFLLAQGADNGDELDEFNEAPHVLNNYVEPSDLTKIIA